MTPLIYPPARRASARPPVYQSGHFRQSRPCSGNLPRFSKNRHSSRDGRCQPSLRARAGLASSAAGKLAGIPFPLSAQPSLGIVRDVISIFEKEGRELSRLLTDALSDFL